MVRLAWSVAPPAAGLPQQTFGRSASLEWVLLCGAAGAFMEACLGVTAIFTDMPAFAYLFVLAVSAASAAIWPALGPRWVAGGEGWLVLLRYRRPKAWVRTGRLINVGWEFRTEGGLEGDLDVVYLLLRDDERRELTMPLKSLTPVAAASLLAGLRQSAGNGLDLTSGSGPYILTALDAKACGRKLPEP